MRNARDVIAGVARDMWERRAWWVNEDPPAALTVLTSGEWYLTPHGVENLVGPRERVLACVIASPLLLSSMVALRDALLDCAGDDSAS